MSPALAGEQGRRQDRDGDLHHEDQRGDVGGGAPLQRRHLAEQRNAGAQPGGEHPPRGCGPVVRAGGVGDELRRQPAPGERRTGGDRGDDAVDAAPSTQRIRRERDGCQDTQRGDERPATGMMRRGIGRHGGQPGHAGDDRGDGQDIAHAHALMERARAQREQEHQAERERRLHDRQRGQQQRGGLQRPAEHAERGPCQPARTARQAGDEREAQTAIGGHDARLDRLQRDAEVVHRGRCACSARAEHDAGHGRWPR
jgi:hypothetical protein